MTIPPARRDRRSDYRNFPSAYGELFMLCRDGERHVLGPFDTEKAARAATRDLYRYRGFLRTAVETDHSDVFARQVHDVARDLKIEVTNGYENNHLDVNTFYIALALNPIVAAVARMTSSSDRAKHGVASVSPQSSPTHRSEGGVASAPVVAMDRYGLPPQDGRGPDHSRSSIFIDHNCWRCANGTQLDNCPTPSTPGNCGFPQARND